MGNSVGLVSTPCGSSGARVLLRAPLLSYGGAVGRVAVAAATRCDRAIGPDEQPELSTATRLSAACIEQPEFDRPKVNRPAIVVYFLEADQFSCEAVAQVPLGLAKGDHAIWIGPLYLKMPWILRVRELSRIGAERGLILRCG